MMPYLKQIYHEGFFKQWGNQHEEYVSSAKIISEKIYEMFKPASLVDFGCGCGVYSHFLTQCGAKVLSLDGVVPPQKEAYPVPIETVDLSTPIENRWGRFDLGLCLEVAEHIPQCFSDIFLSNLIQFSDTLLLSAAPPHQGGTFHVNEQPKRYWVQKLSKLGFVYDRVTTGKLFEYFKLNRPHYMWMCDQISVYRKVKTYSSEEKNLPFRVRLPAPAR